ncbi:hypothetical protein SAMN04490357_0898 [Streptomyces misionensis]|uniref:Gram-positive cocci surface proteins LPxTG domain-containing protein n=1 Tax=Streptomyces misionensis TaxID=67331 RepID=A0A1H4NU11_9ACTN|nr:hypothetical protein [Streptomyces misionensis]SEB98727.1 hypothetical protein SAMN04490357_0898 [Streptomyces misionensis]
MPFSSPGPRALRQSAGAFGAVALIALGATPATAADDPTTGLVLGGIAPFEKVKPGSDLQLAPTFTNTGDAALDKVWMSYSVTRGLSQPEVPANCLRYEIAAADEEPGRSEVVCEFDQPVRPGVVYAPERPLSLKALDRALYDRLRVTVDSADTGPGDNASAPVRGTAPAVKLAERPDQKPAQPGSGQHDGWDAADVTVTADNTADFQVTGARLRGRVGDTVTLRVTYKNAGPAWVLRDLGQSATHVLVTLPEGTSMVRADGFCKNTGAESYACGTGESWVTEGGGQTYTFKVKIDEAAPGAKGYVELAEEPRPFDHVKKNDTAVVTLAVTGGGSTGGGAQGGGDATGGTGSTTTTGGTGKGTGGTATTGGSSTTGGTTGTSGTAATGGTGGTSGTTTGGSLANTGAGSALPLAGAAGAAVLAGAGVLVAVRRRGGRPE